MVVPAVTIPFCRKRSLSFPSCSGMPLGIGSERESSALSGLFWSGCCCVDCLGVQLSWGCSSFMVTSATPEDPSSVGTVASDESLLGAPVAAGFH